MVAVSLPISSLAAVKAVQSLKKMEQPVVHAEVFCHSREGFILGILISLEEV